MSCGSNTANTRLGPRPSGASSTARDAQRITGAGNVSQPTTTVLVPGTYATLKNGPTYSIRFRLGSTTPTAVSTDVPLAPYETYEWAVDEHTKYVAAVEVTATAANTIEYFVWQSSPSP